MSPASGSPGIIFMLTLLGALASCSFLARPGVPDPSGVPFANAYVDPQDSGKRVAPSYFLRRAWMEITRDSRTMEAPATSRLDVQEMARRRFAVSWLGHASLLVRAGSKWIMLDPVFSKTAGPVRGVGPSRFTALPIAPEELPHVDIVLISHDHYDHLDLPSMRRLAGQAGGPPRFLVGRGLRPWFAANLSVEAEELGWWEVRQIEDVKLTFVPAQHNSGRSLWNRNLTLWGGWVVEYEGQRFYFPGDTAYVKGLFTDIRSRAGPIHLAALPIGAYEPRELMRFEHMNPRDAVQAHLDLDAARSFGVHWGTFQLGDEEPIRAAEDLHQAVRELGVTGVGLHAIGEVIEVPASGP